MAKYSFIFKPVFFIFNLVFATWLVLAIESVQPSDFGRHASLFEKAPTPRKVTQADKPFLRKLLKDYRLGLIDSASVEKRIDSFLAPVHQ